MLVATLEHFGGVAPTRHRVRDISVGGVRIDSAGSLQSGASVLVSVGALEAVMATVKWVRLGFAGIAFAEEIELDDARKKAAIAPSMTASSITGAALGTVKAPTAGWAAEMRSPYRK